MMVGAGGWSSGKQRVPTLTANRMPHLLPFLLPPPTPHLQCLEVTALWQRLAPLQPRQQARRVPHLAQQLAGAKKGGRVGGQQEAR